MVKCLATDAQWLCILYLLIILQDCVLSMHALFSDGPLLLSLGAVKSLAASQPFFVVRHSEIKCFSMACSPVYCLEYDCPSIFLRTIFSPMSISPS